MIGDVLADRFELGSIAGEGGMGTVHRARDRQSGDAVAVKVLAVRGRAEAERFARETALLAELSHPAIVRYLAHGTTSRGEAFLAMEWLEGEDLSQRLARGRLSLDEAVAVAEHVAGALALAHGRGVVHRDVKPSNVFLVGGSPRDARVLDFGIAHVAGAADMTRTGVVVGTPGYMAPEQARGERGIDARADVFALGCVLYECLTGTPAFYGDNLLALLARILLEDPPPPGECTPVPADLNALVMRMLAKEPTARPRDGAAVLEALGSSRLPPPSRAPSPSRSGLGEQENEWLSLVFARDPHHLDTSSARTLAPGEADTRERVALAMAPLGAGIQQLLDGTLVARLPAAGPARDRAVRAARAALAARSALGKDARVALVTGRGLRGARTPLGEVIDRATELLAHPRAADGPRLDAVTAGLLDTRFSLGGDAASLTLRAELAGDEAPRRLLGQPSPCVGREREIATLFGLFEECVAEQLARPVLLTAPAGTGKSRVRIELGARLASRDDLAPPWLARGDVMSAGSPHGLLIQLVRDAAGLHDGEPAEVLRQKLRARVAKHVAPDEAERVAAFLGELVSVPFPDDGLPALRGARRDPVALGDQIMAAWEDFLAAELRAGPRMLVLEDLHWGDLPTVRACDRVLRRLKDAPLFLLATARPDVHAVFPDLWAGRDLQEIRLVPLSRRASERLVRGALGADAYDEVVARIVARAEGNAFVLEELVRAAATDGADSLPDTVLAMTAARLDALPDGHRRVLRAASVFGEVFWRGGVAALAGEEGLDGVLASLAEQEIVEPRRQSRFEGERELSFRHALLRDAAYATLTPDDLQTGHRLAAAWLEGAGERDDLGLAEHLERGAAPAEAATFLARAAERALEGNDFAAVVRHAERALAAGGGAAGPAACHRLVADAEQWRGRYEAGLAAARSATELYASGSPGWYRSVMLQAVCLQRLGRWPALRAIAELAADDRPAPGAEAARVEVLVRLAMRMEFFDQAGPTARLLDLAERSAPPEPDEAARGWLEAGTATRAHARGDLPVYLEHIDRAADLLRRAGNVRDALSQLEDEGWWWHHCGHSDRAIEVTCSVIAEAERMGLRRLEVNARMALVWEKVGTSHGDQAVIDAQRLVHDLPEGGADRTNATVFLGWSLHVAGRFEEALQELEAALARLTPRGGYARVCQSLRVEALFALGRIDEARHGADELACVLAGDPTAPHFEIEGHTRLARVRQKLGEVDVARAHITIACDHAQRLVAGFSDSAARERALRHVPHHANAIALARELGVDTPLTSGPR